MNKNKKSTIGAFNPIRQRPADRVLSIGTSSSPAELPSPSARQSTAAAEAAEAAKVVAESPSSSSGEEIRTEPISAAAAVNTAAIIPAASSAVISSSRSTRDTPKMPSATEDAVPQKRTSTRRERVTFMIEARLVERARDVVYWEPGLTLNDVAEEAVSAYLTARERTRGTAYPPRPTSLRPGRPIK